jgi:hypothetical protein
MKENGPLHLTFQVREGVAVVSGGCCQCQCGIPCVVRMLCVVLDHWHCVAVSIRHREGEGGATYPPPPLPHVF